MKKFTYGSVCSGIEAATVAWKDFAKCVWLSEVDSFPCAVLSHHYPNTPNLGDMTKIKGKILSREIEAPDILVGGTPCQAFSLMGSRKSLGDVRGQLTLAFVELANAIDEIRIQDGKEPVIILWENVPAVTRTADNAFGCFLGGLAKTNCELQPPRGKWGRFGYIGGGVKSLGECLILNISESPNEEREFSLWQVLEKTPHQKYFLTKSNALSLVRKAERLKRMLSPTLVRKVIERHLRD